MRMPFSNRPWITGKLYDDLARRSVLHCDAYVAILANFKALLIEYRTGGRERIALDGYMIEPDGLTPLWDASALQPLSYASWGAAGVPWPTLHARVVEQAATAADAGAATGRWRRVSLLAHYVPRPDTDCEIRDNAYTRKILDT